jgi:hypothetical protein
MIRRPFQLTIHAEKFIESLRVQVDKFAVGNLRVRPRMDEIFFRQFRGASVPPEHLRQLLQTGLVALTEVGEAPVSEQRGTSQSSTRTGSKNVLAEATCRIRAAFNSSCTHFDLTAAGESTIRKYFASEIPLLIFPGMLSPSRTSSLLYQTGTPRAAKSETSRSTKFLSLLA